MDTHIFIVIQIHLDWTVHVLDPTREKSHCFLPLPGNLRKSHPVSGSTLPARQPRSVEAVIQSVRAREAAKRQAVSRRQRPSNKSHTGGGRHAPTARTKELIATQALCQRVEVRTVLHFHRIPGQPAVRQEHVAYCGQGCRGQRLASPQESKGATKLPGLCQFYSPPMYRDTHPSSFH